MDDVHIAQFAALLRTLKQKGRQVILAVHDRQLFDYLALELSPTFNGDRVGVAPLTYINARRDAFRLIGVLLAARTRLNAA